MINSKDTVHFDARRAHSPVFVTPRSHMIPFTRHGCEYPHCTTEKNQWCLQGDFVFFKVINLRGP
jgi:hypothetical protein